MNRVKEFRQHLFKASASDFADKAISLFRYQAVHNPVYRKYLRFLKINPESVSGIEQIPFLPIEFFRVHKVATGKRKIKKVFASSGTTGTLLSKHYLADTGLYEESILTGFRLFYGEPSAYCMIGYFPQREDASLTYMMEYLIRTGRHALSGFYFDKTDRLVEVLCRLKEKQQKAILVGVSYALLDLTEELKKGGRGKIAENRLKELFQYVTVIETGGMKGKREALTRAGLHQALQEQSGISSIHSEYGMTELLSQAYSQGNGIFRCPPWMRILLRDVNDPLSLVGYRQTGGINVIDLANLYSCAFIATADLGKGYADGSFEVLGRMDNSDIRGCNLMVE